MFLSVSMQSSVVWLIPCLNLQRVCFWHSSSSALVFFFFFTMQKSILFRASVWLLAWSVFFLYIYMNDYLYFCLHQNCSFLHSGWYVGFITFLYSILISFQHTIKIQSIEVVLCSFLFFFVPDSPLFYLKKNVEFQLVIAQGRGSPTFICK